MSETRGPNSNTAIVCLCYLMFFSREVRAFTTALKASSLPGATHLSGWSRTANFLYALFTSSLETRRQRRSTIRRFHMLHLLMLQCQTSFRNLSI